MLLIGAGPAYAANYVVDSTADGPDVAPGVGGCATAAATCTLRAAMEDAQALGGTNTITLFGLPAPSTINLGSALPTISSQTLTIVGAGQDALTVRRVSGGDYPIFTTNASAVIIRGMTITQGRAVPQGGQVLGGGIYSLAGSLDLEDVGVVGNAAAMSGETALAGGGGVHKEQGTLTIRDSTISQNTVDVTSSDDGRAFGAGIAASSVTGFEVFNSTISHNSVAATGPDSASASGGGISMFGTTIQIVDSTVSANSAAVVGTESGEASGGGIWASGTAFSMVRSTVDHNSATATNVPTGPLVLGGGLYVTGTSVVNVVISTISANSAAATPGGTDDVVAGGGLGVLSGALKISGSTLAFNVAPQGANLSDAAQSARLRNTILSDPLGGGLNCLEAAPTLASDGYNLASDASCALTGPGDQPSTNPLLQALANNGGPTWTHALPLASPAVDKGNAAAVGTHPALTTDQRGQPRPLDQPSVVNAADGSDVGAFEREVAEYASTILAAGPAGYWRFGEPSGTALLDSSGHNNNGTYLGGVALGALGIPGAFRTPRQPTTASTTPAASRTQTRWTSATRSRSRAGSSAPRRPRRTSCSTRAPTASNSSS